MHTLAFRLAWLRPEKSACKGNFQRWFNVETT